MLKTLPALALAAALCLNAQPQTITITVVPHNGSSLLQKLWQLILRPRTIIGDFACDLTEMEPGDSTQCTISLNQPARVPGYPVDITVPPGFTGPGSITIPAGAGTATFSISRLDLSGAIGPQILPTAISVWAVNQPGTATYADVGIPCCALRDQCHVPPEKLSQRPCTP